MSRYPASKDSILELKFIAFFIESKKYTENGDLIDCLEAQATVFSVYGLIADESLWWLGDFCCRQEAQKYTELKYKEIA